MRESPLPMTDNPAPSALRIVLSARAAMLRNGLRRIHGYLWIHVVVGLSVLLGLLAGGGVLFHAMFRFLLAQEIFGGPLMERLVAIIFLAFFSMLTFSNLIITLTTTYISRDTEFLFGYPISSRSIFSIKLAESIAYSSWAFVLLSLPLFIAYGVSKNAPLFYYPLSLAFGLPFLAIPACLGAIATMLISALLPARRARGYSVGLVLAGAAIAFAIVRMMGLHTLLNRAETDEFGQIMSLLNVGSAPLLPNYWLASAMKTASEGHWKEALWWGWCLVATAGAILQLCLWLAPPLYYKGWVLAREAAASTREANGRWSPFRITDILLWPVRPGMRALIGKDIRTFWRDPAQWSQLVILFGLLVIYIANIRGLTSRLSAIENFLPDWPVLLSFFNLAATCFVICILTTRFVYPMLSLEGRQYWVIGLAPFPKRHLVWEKFGLCLTLTALLAVSLIAFSNSRLQLHSTLSFISLVTTVLLAVGLSSMAVGLGAIFPDFRQDNPARIANGLGGTANIVLSLAYIGAALGLALPPTLMLLRLLRQGDATAVAISRTLSHGWPWVAAYFLLHGLALFLPLVLGVRRWDRLEIHL